MQFQPQHPLIACPAPLREQPRLDLSVPQDFRERPALVAHVEAARAAAPYGFVWGGYLEQRNIYRESDHFYAGDQPRDIHLGIDIWADAGTSVYAPLDGRVHSCQDNVGFCNYGPTLIVEHHLSTSTLYTLYGHLSRESLDQWVPEAEIKAGQEIARLGAWEENGDWPPHLHFQLMWDLEDWWGDYPGACTMSERETYARNCPDPTPFLI